MIRLRQLACGALACIAALTATSIASGGDAPLSAEIDPRAAPATPSETPASSENARKREQKAAEDAVAIALAQALGGRGPATGRPIRPRSIVVATVPPLPGVSVVLGESQHVTGTLGSVRVLPETLTPVGSRLQIEPVAIAPGVRASFIRWYGNPDRFRVTKLTAAMKLDYEVRFAFTDRRGGTVPLEQITKLVIRSSHGVIHEFTGAELREGQWLQGSRVVSTPTGPISKDLQYSIEKVIVDATNVVNRAQQRFIPSEVQELDVELLFFTARITARDALFGFPVGTAVRLQHPDGRWQVIDLDDNAAVTIDALPRGEYFIEVKGPGLSFVHPVALSRDQDVDLQVLTYLDISVALALGGIAVIGVLFVGRPYLFRRLRRRRHRAPVAHTPGEPA